MKPSLPAQLMLLIAAPLTTSLGCTGGASQCSATLSSGREVNVSTDGFYVSLETTNEGAARVRTPFHTASIEQARLVVDGVQAASIPADAKVIVLAWRRGELRVTADGQRVLLR